MNKIDGAFDGVALNDHVDEAEGKNTTTQAGGPLVPPPGRPRPPRAPHNQGPRHNRFDALSRLIGKPAAEKLVAQFGGRKINIPSTMPPRHSLAQAIGPAKARLLARAYGGTWLVVPVGPASFQKKKQDRALALLAEGHTIKDITRLTGLSDRTIQRLKAKIKKDD